MRNILNNAGMADIWQHQHVQNGNSFNCILKQCLVDTALQTTDSDIDSSSN